MTSKITKKVLSLILMAFLVSVLVIQVTHHQNKNLDDQPPSQKVSTTVIDGAGTTSPNVLFERWFADYHQQNSHIQINYQSIGSGAGRRKFITQTLDFAVSDIAMTDEEIAQVKRGVIQFPITAWTIAIVYNLAGVKKLNLSQSVLADIFLGKITRWDDPRVAAINPGLTLPNLSITLVHRADGSHTTLILTQYLSAISPEWRQRVGSGLSVKWLTGIGAKGGSLFHAFRGTEGAISYYESAFASSNRASTATLQNRAGNYVQPTITSSMKTLDVVDLPENLRVSIINPAGKDVYPLVNYVWLLTYKSYPKTKGQALKDVLKWSLTDGQKISSQLGYVPFPPRIVQRALAAVDSIQIITQAPLEPSPHKAQCTGTKSSDR
jgi:phosphate transport system substrate-binding protein